MLASALKQYRRQQHIAAAGLVDVRRMSSRGSRAIAARLTAYQLASIFAALEAAPDILSEQGISTAIDGTVVSASLVTGQGAAPLYDKVTSDFRVRHVDAGADPRRRAYRSRGRHGR